MADSALDFSDQRILVDPYPAYRQLRECDPVHWDHAEGGWMVTRYRDVAQALLEPSLSARPELEPPDAAELEARWGQEAPVRRHIRTWMLFRDPPDHGRLRRVMQPPLVSSAVEPLRASLGSEVRPLLERACEQGTIDGVSELAVPLARSALAWALAVPESALERASVWSDDLLDFINVEATPSLTARARTSLDELTQFTSDVLTLPPDSNSLRAHLADAARVGSVDPDEAAGIVAQAVTGVLGALVHLIGNALLALASSPQQFGILHHDPSLAGRAVEEALRLDAPFLLVARTATCDLRLGDANVSRGDRIGLMLAAANRDDAVFVEPDAYDLARSHLRHLAFGAGSHYCAGASLTRLAAAVALGAVAECFEEIEADDSAVERLTLFGLRGLTRLPLIVARAR